MREGSVSGTTLTAVVVATTAALVFRSWLQVELVQQGIERYAAADLSYLIVPPTLALLLFPLWRQQRPFLAAMFSTKVLTIKIVLQSLAIGLLLRLASWAQLIAGVSFGLHRPDNVDTAVEIEFSFQCAPLEWVLLGFLVMMILVPLIEEVVHRGYVMSMLRDRGAVVSILVSALIFTVFHRVGTWWFVLCAGLVLGTLYWKTRSVWPSLISHAVVNGMIQIDWRCMSTKWTPAKNDLPLLLPGLVSTAVLLGCTIGIIGLLCSIDRKSTARRPWRPAA